MVFLTIDDGVTKTAQVPALMAEFDLPATLFLTRDFVRDNPGFFKDVQARGSLIENHTVSHNINMVRLMSYAQQLAEISGMQDYTQQRFGRRPTVFRPPGGAYFRCHAERGRRRRAESHHHLGSDGQRRPHGLPGRQRPAARRHRPDAFPPEFPADLAAFRQAQLAAGLEAVLLEDFIGAA